MNTLLKAYQTTKQLIATACNADDKSVENILRRNLYSVDDITQAQEFVKLCEDMGLQRLGN